MRVLDVRVQENAVDEVDALDAVSAPAAQSDHTVTSAEAAVLVRLALRTRRAAFGVLTR